MTLQEGIEAGTLTRALAYDQTIRVVVADTTALVERLRTVHDAGPVGTMALGRVATAALLLSAGLKERQQVGVQINSDGPMGEIYAIADWRGFVRATIGDPQVNVDMSQGLALGPTIGQGRITVTKKLSDEAPYRGVVPLVTGEIAEDLAHYLLSSEQVPSAVVIGEHLSNEGVQAAGGLLIQAMPGASDGTVGEIITRLESLPPISRLLADGHSVEDVLDMLISAPEVLVQTKAKHYCTCSREHFARKLCLLGEKDLKELTDELEVVDTQCHFCRTIYSFDREQVNALLYGARMVDLAD